MTTERPVSNTEIPQSVTLSDEEHARREFLKKAGRFAVLTPPTVTLLLSTSMNSNAIATSGGKSYGNNGGGNGGGDGVNPGSFKGGGVSRGGNGANQSQSGTKGSDVNR